MKKFILAAVALLAFTGCSQIDSGNIGVRTWMGKVNPSPLSPGVTVTIDSVTEFTAKEVLIPIADLKPKSQDNLTLQDLDLDIYVATDPAKVPSLFVKYQGDYIQHGNIVEGSNTPHVNVMGYQRITREAREAAFKAVARFPATTMHTRRDELASAIREALQDGLNATDPDAFIVSNVNVRQLTTDPGIEASIRAQVQMDQDILKKQKEVELAQAEAERLVALAQGEADANGILAASLNDKVMQLRMAEIQRDTIVNSAKAGNTVVYGMEGALVQTK